jgi:predicted small metal-binding protein
MAKVINCECGSTVDAGDDDTLVSRVEAHVQQVHPDLVGTMSRDDILAMAEEV